MKIYIALATLAICSFFVAYTLPTDEMLKGIYASPGLLALFGVLYQVLRDQSAHERNLEIQKRQQVFNIGATSHMANVAFDKHVEFCEKYMQEVHETVSTLFREGPTDKALSHAGNFHTLRQEYAAWLTDDINENLFPFEQALRSLGAGEHFIRQTTGAPQYQEQRSKHIDKVYKDFSKILTIEEGAEPDPVVATEVVKKKVRDILDIEQLVQLRKRLIEEANNAINT
ncbi:hypothetical protein [Candidatus Endoriftia persephonae]|jgi:hypothetical protein|uniref:Uncharacterized protein n=1 Tax=Candidatus Endoriftia persephonae TaxID=393765 RepID=A0A9J6ZUB6_9GAMM|nr:hypothetical protein [Candidatus Endoriftia persephone]USF86380.1 hypothetical protein L0Y14_09500 [Candidatus Endoriftia persephone]